MNNSSIILEGLNPAQQSAVVTPASVVQILAPPGSGKTKTLTARVAHLLSHHGYQPWDILCLTFTIKSAKEMKERITRLIGNDAGSKLVLGTFHSVCRRYLVNYGHLIGLRKGFGIADSSDSQSIINRIIKRLQVNIDSKAARSRISSSKARNIGCAELRVEGVKKKNVDQQEFVRVFEAYEAHLATSNLLDYDDLLLRCVDLLRQNPSCVSNVEAVLIDEFQDTNLVQFDLMNLFAAQNHRITTVGDPDQSIYGWRSAEIKNLRRMQKQYPETLIIHLEDNYRSSGAILIAALEIIEQDNSRPQKSLLPTHCPGTIPVLRRLPSAFIEASWIVSEIKRCIGMAGSLLNYSDFAILLRSASLSRHIEAAMGKAGMPYRMVGGLRFFDRAEIKVLLDYLRVISQPDNSDALARIVNTPSRRIGDVTIKALLEEAAARKMTLWSLIRGVLHTDITARTKLSKLATQGLSSLINIILTCRSKLLENLNPLLPKQILEYVIKKLAFEDHLKKVHPEDYDTRWANVEELMAQASDCSMVDTFSDGDDLLPQIEGIEAQPLNKAEESLSTFLANVALSTEIQEEEDAQDEGKPKEKVTISTIHAAKGLEWPAVFIPSVFEGSIPHSRAEDTDEERRLLYVAMTRAQALLYLSCPSKNSMRDETTLSQFLSPKTVAAYLVDKGPTMTYSAIFDMAQILRRECPSEAALLMGMEELMSQEDDLWSLNGEEDPQAVEKKWNNHSTDAATYHQKSKPQHDTSSRAPTHTTISSTMPYNVNINMHKKGVTYTMPPQTSGFVTATFQLQHMEEESGGDSRKRPRLADSSDSRPKTIKSAKTMKGVGAQGSLMSYWGSQKDERPILKRPTELAGSEPRNALPPICKHLQPALDSQLETERDMRTASAAHPTSISKPLSQIAQSISRKPKSIIPKSLANHTFRSVTSNRRPQFLTRDDQNLAKPYSFLSSSPPSAAMEAELRSIPLAKDEANLAKPNIFRSNALPRAAIAEENRPKHLAVDEQNFAKRDIFFPKSPPCAALEEESRKDEITTVQVQSLVKTNSSTGTNPTSYHNTTMLQMQSQTSAPKKTLGVRRSMVGWSTRGNHTFSTPRISGTYPSTARRS